MGQKKSQKIPSKFPTKFSKFPCEKSKKKSTDELLQERRENNLVSSVEWPKFLFTKPGFWEHFVDLPRKTAKHRIHQFFSPDPRNLLHLIFRDWPRSGEFWQHFLDTTCIVRLTMNMQTWYAGYHGSFVGWNSLRFAVAIEWKRVCTSMCMCKHWFDVRCSLLRESDACQNSSYSDIAHTLAFCSWHAFAYIHVLLCWGFLFQYAFNVSESKHQHKKWEKHC